MIIHAHIKPNAKVDSITVKKNELHVCIRAVPENGKANKYLISYFSKIFKVSKSSITILKGLNTPHKTISITAGDKHIESILQALQHM